MASRFRRLGDLSDLQKGIQLALEALAATPLDHPGRLDRLSNLGNLIHSRFERLGAVDDLQTSIKWAKEALVATSLDHVSRAGRLGNLGKQFHSRFKRLGALSDLEQAIQLAVEAVEATPPDHPDRAGRLSNLSNLFHSRFQRLGDLDDLKQAIQWSRAAVTATPLDHPGLAGRVSNLGCYLSNRFDWLGDLKDLEQAIELSEEAVAATPGPPDYSDHPARAGRLNNLATLLSSRFMRLGALDDLQEAIKKSGYAVAATPLNHPDRAAILNNLGNLFHVRFERLGVLDDLEQAIEWSKEGAEASPPDHPDHAIRLANLGSLLYNRFQQLGALVDLEQAIQQSSTALEATPQGHPNVAVILDFLGSQFRSKFQRLGEITDLDRAIKLSGEALEATPADHPDRARRLRWLAIDLELRSPWTGPDGDTPSTQSSDDLHACLRLYLEAFHCRASPPRERIYAARQAAMILTVERRWQEASSLLENAIILLSKVSPRILARDDQERMLSDFTRLAADAVSTALQAAAEVETSDIDVLEAGESNIKSEAQASKAEVSLRETSANTASHCLSLLELGRGIIMGFVIDCRGDIKELKANHPDIFEKFNLLRVEIDAPLVRVHRRQEVKIHDEITDQHRDVTNKHVKITDQHRRRRRINAIREIDENLADIRKLPGFEGFQLPPSPKDLMAMAKEGPIVIFNSTHIRSDAIIVTESGIKALKLPRFVLPKSVIDLDKALTPSEVGIHRSQ